MCSGCSGNYETDPKETDEREEGGDLEEGDPFGLALDEDGSYEDS